MVWPVQLVPVRPVVARAAHVRDVLVRLEQLADRRAQLLRPAHGDPRLPQLQAAAALGPLLGLLGTVTGLIRTFAALGREVGAASMDRVALGISEVLVSTATGILVALFAMVVLKINMAYRSSYLALLERLALSFERNTHQRGINSTKVGRISCIKDA